MRKELPPPLFLPFPLLSSGPQTQPRGLPVVWCHWKAYPATRWSYQMGDRVPEKRCPVGMSFVVSGHVASKGWIWAALWNPKKGGLWERRAGEGTRERRREQSRSVSFSTHSQKNSYCMYTTTVRMIRALNVNRCTMAAEQDVVRRCDRRERAGSPW